MLSKKITENRKIFRTVGFIYGAVGLLVSLLNISTTYLTGRSLSPANAVYVGIGIILIVLSLTKKEDITLFFGKRRVKISIERLSVLIQFFIMILLCTWSILDEYNGQYNVPMLLMAGLMGLKYRILGKNSLIVMVLLFAALFEVSAITSGFYLEGLYIVLFSAFFFGIVIIMYQEDLKRHFDEIEDYHDKLVRLGKVIEKFKGQCVDVSSINFTPRELEVLRAICITRATNQELADSMGLKMQTIKTHLRNIFDKSGVDDRYQLIDLFKNNFIK